MIETAENEEKEINDALLLSEEQRSLSSGTSPDMTHKRIQRIRSMEKAFQEIQRERCGETTRNEHEGNEDSIWEISWQRLRDNQSRRSQLLPMGTQRRYGNPAVIEFRNCIKARDEQWEEQCREQ